MRLPLLALMLAGAYAQSSGAASDNQGSSTNNTDDSVATSGPLNHTAPPWWPFDAPPAGTVHNTSFSFLSPMVAFHPASADAASAVWLTDNLGAFTNGSFDNTSVSIATEASGMAFRYTLFNETALPTILVDGNVTAANVTLNITNSTAEVHGLPYGFHTFALNFAQGKVGFYSAKPVTDGAPWRFLEPGVLPQSAANATDITVHGNWTADHRLSTTATNSSLTIRPRNGTSLLELTLDAPTAPFPPFTVSITPNPPYGPANETIRPSLQPAEIQAAIAQIGVVIYSRVLDPAKEYTVQVTYDGNGNGTAFAVDKIGVYDNGNVTTTNTTQSAAQGNKDSAASATRAPIVTVAFLGLVLLYM